MKTLEDVIDKIDQLREVINAHSDTIKKLSSINKKQKNKIYLLEQQMIGVKMKLDSSNSDNGFDSGIFGNMFK